jgi:cytochrome b561
MGEASDGYSATQKVLHWVIAVLIAVMVPVGIGIANLLEPGPVTNILYEVHKSIGVTVFSLALVRILVRWRRGAPPVVPGLPSWQRAAAYSSHYALYLLIVLVPLTGWAATSVCCAPVNWFWTVPVTLPLSGGGMEASEPIFQVHRALALTLTGIVLIHAGAALHHHFVRRDRTLARMLPGARAVPERQHIPVADPAGRP